MTLTAETSSLEKNTAPCVGLRVLDLSRTIGGAFCAMVMAALGAEVIKIEPPRTGDPTRSIGPFPGDTPHPEKGGLFLYLNMGKKGVTLDLDAPAGRDIFRRLVSCADAVVEDWGPGALDSLELGFEHLHALNKRLILVSLSPFGANGPYSNYKASDITVFAMSGQMYLMGSPDREPLNFGGAPLQYLAGMNALAGAMIALYDASGEGRHVDVAVVESAAYMDLRSTEIYQYKGLLSARRETCQFLPCKDGWVYIQPFPHEWGRFAQAVEMPELERDPRFATRDLRQEHAQELSEVLLAWTGSRTKEEIYHQLQAARMSCAYLAGATELFDSPQYQARGYFAEVEHPVAGDYLFPGLPFKLSGRRPPLRRAPLLGEHNQEVFCRLVGLASDKLAVLHRDVVI